MSLNELIEFDRHLLLSLNGSDSLFWDQLMWGITSTVAWVPVAVVLFYVFIKNNSMREVCLILLTLVLVILLADQFSSSFCKPYFARFRPSQDPYIMYMVDVVNGYRGGRYGFISSHAANTFAVCVFLALLIRNVYMTSSLVLWAMLCSYSRIYLGVHYPGDILCGALWGIFVGVVFYLLYVFLQRRFFQRKEVISTQYTSSGYAVADLDVFQMVLYFTYLVLAIRAVVV